MQKLMFIDEIADYSEYLDAKMLEYLRSGVTESFESFENFDLMAFDWYDVRSDDAGTHRLLIYIDREDLFFFCTDKHVYDMAEGLYRDGQTNERALYLFLTGLLRNDMDMLVSFESKISEAEEDALDGSRGDYLDEIREFRRELLRLKRYYEQISVICDNLQTNDNEMFTRQGARYFSVIGNRADRLLTGVLNLRDYVTQMREACQSQIDLEQNKLMRVFTVITAVFLPLTLIVGWYGMNFTNMPELTWKYGYLGVIVLSVAVCIWLLVSFKKKKWL